MMGTMSKTTAIGFVRASYWAGAVFDALVLVPMLSPDVARTAFGMRNFNPGNEYRYAMYIAASLMFGWVGLLIWADRRPLERRGVLLLTIVPDDAVTLVQGTHGELAETADRNGTTLPEPTPYQASAKAWRRGSA